MRCRSCLLAVAVILAASNLAGQDSSPTTDLQAVTVVQQTFAVMGGQAVAPVSSVLLKGRVLQQGGVEQRTGTITYKMLGRDRLRLDIQIDGIPETESVVINQRRGLERKGATSVSLPYHSVLTHRLQLIPVFSELASCGDPRFRCTYLGIVETADRLAHRIQLEKTFPGRSSERAAILANLSRVDYYIDTTTLLPIKRAQRVSSLHRLENRYVEEHYYEEFEMFEGVAVPRRIRVHFEGSPFREINFTSVEFNRGVNSADFEVQ